MKCFFLFLFLSLPALAGIPVDLVVDIDLTIVALVSDKANSDLLGGPSENIVTVGEERYRVFEGVKDRFAEWVREKQAAGQVRLHFFSGGTEVRNENLLKNIKMKDGTSLWDLCEGRAFGRTSMTPTGLGPLHRTRDRYKKDLTKINPDISDVIIVDDIKEFVADGQRGHVLWLGEDFPFPDRYHGKPLPRSVNSDLKAREYYKYDWIIEKLDRALKERIRTGRSMSSLIQEISGAQTLTPFTSKWAVPSLSCDPVKIIDGLLGPGL
jgi:hypothetical protein